MNDYEEIIRRLERIETRLCKFIEAMGYNPVNIDSGPRKNHWNVDFLDECECNAMGGVRDEN